LTQPAPAVSERPRPTKYQVVPVENVVNVAAPAATAHRKPAVAFTILEWGRPAAIEPAALDPDIAALLRRWADPNLTEQERFHIRETVRYLAYRPGVPLVRDVVTAGRHMAYPYQKVESRS